MTTSDKLAAKIAQLIKRGEIDPAKVKSIEKKVGMKLDLTAEQLLWATLVYANRQEFNKNNIELTMEKEIIYKAIESYYKLARRNLLKNWQPIMAKTFAREKGFREAILNKKSKEVVFFTPDERESNGYKYVIFPKSYGKKYRRSRGIIYFVVTPVCIFGKQLYLYYGNNFTECQVYTKHFFERYMERHLGINGTPSYYTIASYLKETDCVVAFGEINHEKYENCLYGATKIGVACGTKVADNIMYFSTYIDNSTIEKGAKNMMKDVGNQVFSQLFDKEGVRVAFIK